MSNELTFRPGDVFFVMHHDNWLSRAIAWWMDSRWSHAGMVLCQTEKRTFTVETTDFEVAFSEIGKYISDPNVSIEVWRLPMDEDAASACADRAAELNQVVYGYLQLLISLNIRELLRKFGIRVKNFIRQSYVCNQVVLYGLQRSGLPAFSGIDPKQYQTQETYDMVVGSGAQLLLRLEKR